MYKNCLLSCLLLVTGLPTTSEAITKRNANIMTNSTGLLGSFFGAGLAIKFGSNVKSTGKISNQDISKVLVSGLISGGLCAILAHLFFNRLTPEARLQKAQDILSSLQIEPLIVIIYAHDYTEAAQRIYVRHLYPALDAWDKLSNHLDAVIEAKILLELAVKEVLPYTQIYNHAHDKLEIAMMLETQIRDKLFVLKQALAYKEQFNDRQVRDLAQAKIAAQQAKAQAELSKALAEHERNKIKLMELNKAK